jgi:hypothetical protein
MLFDNGDGITCCLTLLPGETGGQPGDHVIKKGRITALLPIQLEYSTRVNL